MVCPSPKKDERTHNTQSIDQILFNFQSGQIYCFLKTCDIIPGCSQFYQSPDTCCPICVGKFYSRRLIG